MHTYKILLSSHTHRLLFMCACENDVNEVRELGRKNRVLRKENSLIVILVWTENRAHLTARKCYVTREIAPEAEFPKSLHVDFYNDSTKIESQLNARYGRYSNQRIKYF